MDIVVTAGGRLTWPGGEMRCALGRGGIRPDKREGDGGTPVGTFALRRVVYRPDRVDPPRTSLPVAPIARDDGWCDDPAHPDYNRPVKLPFAAGHEVMWRGDGLYDVVVVLGHNDAPVVPAAGSAVFLHVARPDWGPTAGCVALTRDDLLHLLSHCAPGDTITIRAAD